MKKNKPLPPSTSASLPVGTRVEIIEPHPLWSGMRGVVETHGNGLHIVRVKYQEKPQTFLVAAPYEELLELPKDKSTPS